MNTKAVASVLASLIAFQSVFAGPQVAPRKPKPKPKMWAEAIVAAIFAVVIVVILKSLHHTCKRQFDKPQKPPPDKDPDSVSQATIGQSVQVQFTPDASC